MIGIYNNIILYTTIGRKCEGPGESERNGDRWRMRERNK